MLKVENIVKYYGKNLAVNKLSFGKTTTFRIILGLLDSDSGQVLLNNKKIDYNITDKIGYVTEDRSLLTKMTVKEQLIFYGSLKGMKEKEISEKIDYLLNFFEISDYKNRKIKELSKGNQQKIQFISAVINDPILLILDEPFTGLDPINVALFKKFIKKLQKDGCIIIFSSHQMEHIEEFCEKLTILVKGKTVLNGYIKDIKKEYRKHNIFIKGDIEVSSLKKIKGVIDVVENDDEYIVKIEDYDIVDKVFKEIKNYKIDKFVVEEATLNEIFIDKVGGKNEK